MTDRYHQFATTGFGRKIIKQLGLPSPTSLRRRQAGEPDIAGPVLLGASDHGSLAEAARKTLTNLGVEVHAEPDDTPYGVLVFDATAVTLSSELRAVYDFFHPMIRNVTPSGRVIVLAGAPEDADDPRAAAAQRALEGFVKSVGKEVGRGATANLIRVSAGVDQAIGSTLRFLASARSAYVSGQAIRVAAAGPAAPVGTAGLADTAMPLNGQTALVTGAARGIGATIAEVLSGYGAAVVCLDIPAAGAELSHIANRIGGSALQLDITRADAPRVIADHFTSRHNGLDIMVHNAGITRDKTLGKMSEQQWNSVIDVNVASQERIDEVLLAENVLRERGRIVGVSSISGIAGNAGQTNYATSKAAVAGRVASLAPMMRERRGTINAVAPGFIETRMTAKVPLPIRQAGRLMNSMSQGGLPVDVAETIAWLADPASAGVNGNVVRVCGQSLLGA